MRKRLIPLLIIVFAAPLWALAAVPQVGEEAPDFTLPTLDGKSFQLSQAIPANPGETKGVVLAFFATWCGPCRYELPELEKLHRAYKDKGIKVVALCLDEDLTPAELKKFVKKLDLTFPIALDPKGKAARSYGVRPIPNSFIIGPNRKIEGRYIGYSKKNIQDITKLVQQLAGKGSQSKSSQ